MQVLQDLRHKWGMPHVCHILAYRFNSKLDRFVSRYRDPLAEAMNALMAL